MYQQMPRRTRISSIDVVVPCFQYGRFLRDSVGSVLRQGIDSLRVLIIDNASTDNSLDVAFQLASEDKRVHVIAHETNLGQQASLNEGIDWVAADYFMILDADDLLVPGSLRRAISILDKDPSIVFCHGVQHISTDGTFANARSGEERDADWHISSGREFVSRLCAKGYNTVAWPTVVRRTSVQKEVGHYDPDLNYANDMNMWLRLATRGNVAETSAVQGIRRTHPAQMTQAYRDSPVMDLVEHLNNFQHFFRYEGAGLSGAERERGRVTRRIAFNGLYMAATLMRNRRLKQGLMCLDFSIRTYGGLLVEYLGVRQAHRSGAG
jgi:glycosyltransferase involved in cell wall biosynthesis